MIHIHPFPARMAPEIALNKLSELQEGQTVLDPMSGSGMVLSLAARRNIKSIGVDSDPLARLISLVGATKIIEDDVILAFQRLFNEAKKIDPYEISLPWIDEDRETQKFIAYWFAEKQIRQLRTLSYCLVIDQKLIPDEKIRNILFVSISRLIITKEPKASLARDTAHSRPHRTKTENDFDIFEALPSSISHVLRALTVSEISADTQSYLGDARNLKEIKNGQIDAVITSPPYLNAIDYMRGHKFSLIWFGYRISDLKLIRGKSIGTELTVGNKTNREFEKLLQVNKLDDVDPKKIQIIQKYFADLCDQLNEIYRVLRSGGFATYVIGNSSIRGKLIKNNELLKKAAELAGLVFDEEFIREIPENRRYLPINVTSHNSLSKRMRTEHVISFIKLL